MSEDLDFAIPMPVDAPRSARSSRAKGLKEIIANLPDELPFARVVTPLTGTNNSTQYNAVIGYASTVGGREETITIEVSLREPLLLPSVDGEASTILLDPASGERMVPIRKVRCISQTEAFAEKFRAALARREVAVRDFFDLDYAVRRLGLKPDDADLIALVRTKINVPGQGPVDVSDSRVTSLRQQLDPQLRSVLRAEDFSAFKLDRAVNLVVTMATRIA